MYVLRLVITAALVAEFAGRCATAAEPSEELAELRLRIESLEKQNTALAEAINGRAEVDDRLWLSYDSSHPSGPAAASQHDAQNVDSLLAEQPEFCAPEEIASESDLHMTASWHHGLELKTKDEDFRVHVGGRTQFDTGWFSADENVQENINIPYEDGVDFRRGRLRIDGTMYATIDWAVEYDFFNSFRLDGVDRAVTAPTDLWWTFKEVPCVGNIRVGNQKPAIGFEHLVSSRFLPFMERSYNQDTFYGGAFNGFLPGIAFFDTYGVDDRGTWNVGLFKPTDNVFAANAHDGDHFVATRITWLPWYECEGARLLHLGGSVTQHTTVDNRTVFRTRDAIRTGLSGSWPVPATTGEIFGDDMQWLNGELVAVNGPWTFQAEYLTSYLHDAAPIVGGAVQPGVGTVMYHGGYAQILFYLTGEHDHYNKQTGAFDRVIPRHNFAWGRHARRVDEIGAWQIGARYNYLDLNDDGLDGGILNNLTAGLNWFWNPNFKVQLNYMATHRDAPLAGGAGDGWVHGWGIRVAHDF
jgi:phosphate-selective porin OprO/OprP